MQGRKINPLITLLLYPRGQNILEMCARGRACPGHDDPAGNPSPTTAYHHPTGPDAITTPGHRIARAGEAVPQAEGGSRRLAPVPSASHLRSSAKRADQIPLDISQPASRTPAMPLDIPGASHYPTRPCIIIPAVVLMPPNREGTTMRSQQ